MAARLPALRPDRYHVLRPPAALAHRAGHVWEQAVLPLRASRFALLYSPANLAPIASRRNVVVIHDAAAFRHPEAFSATYVAYQRRVLPRVVRRARVVLTVSEFSRSELVELLGAAPERVVVVPNGVDERFVPAVDPEPMRTLYALPRPYVLAVGTASARKNYSALEATVTALDEHGIDFVLAGSDRGYLRGAESGARRIGYVAEEHLPALYAGARALAMPSVYEGFGLPCLEAMAAGTPVVIAPRGALPETCGGKALIADPDEPDEFAAAVLTAACDETVRRRLVAGGLERAARFTWSRTTSLTDQVISNLLEQG